MKAPTEFELQHFITAAYDPAKAHKYYEEHKKLTGRKKAQAQSNASAEKAIARATDPRSGKSKGQIHKNARAKQRMELTVQIQGMERKLGSLEALIKKREHAEKSDDRKGKAKKERAAKEADKPKSAAEKAKATRESAKYKDKHKQELKTKAKQADSKSGGSSKDKKKAGSGKTHSVEQLKTLATKVKGQIAVAKQKLAAL